MCTSKPHLARDITAAAVSRRKGDLAACRRAYYPFGFSACRASCIEGHAGRGARLVIVSSEMRVQSEEE